MNYFLAPTPQKDNGKHPTIARLLSTQGDIVFKVVHQLTIVRGSGMALISTLVPSCKDMYFESIWVPLNVYRICNWSDNISCMSRRPLLNVFAQVAFLFQGPGESWSRLNSDGTASQPDFGWVVIFGEFGPVFLQPFDWIRCILYRESPSGQGLTAQEGPKAKGLDGEGLSRRNPLSTQHKGYRVFRLLWFFCRVGTMEKNLRGFFQRDSAARFILRR